MADFLVIGFRECKKDHIDEGIWSFLVCSSWLLCHRAERSNVGRPAQDIRDLSDNRVFQRQNIRFLFNGHKPFCQLDRR